MAPPHLLQIGLGAKIDGSWRPNLSPLSAELMVSLPFFAL